MPHPNPNRSVTFTHPHTQVHPATVLVDGLGRVIAEFTERRDHYPAGRTVSFGSVRAAKEFVTAINASAGETVCRVGT